MQFDAKKAVLASFDDWSNNARIRQNIEQLSFNTSMALRFVLWVLDEEAAGSTPGRTNFGTKLSVLRRIECTGNFLVWG